MKEDCEIRGLTINQAEPKGSAKILGDTGITTDNGIDVV